MKTYAFARTSASEVLKYDPDKDKKVPRIKFSNYLYFLFAPTLLYRNEYPR